MIKKLTSKKFVSNLIIFVLCIGYLFNVFIKFCENLKIDIYYGMEGVLCI